MRKLSLVCDAVFVYSVIMAPDLIRVMYGPQWGASVEFFRIYQTLLSLRSPPGGSFPWRLDAPGKTSGEP